MIPCLTRTTTRVHSEVCHCNAAALQPNGVQARRACIVARSSEGDQPRGQVSSVDEAYKILGVSEFADFNNIMSAKKRALGKHRGNQEQLEKVEAAYDLILMQSMKNRMSGESAIPTSVRFADVVDTKRIELQRQQGYQLPAIGGFQLSVKRDQQERLGQQAVTYGLLLAWAILGAFFEAPEAKEFDSASTQVSLGLIAALIFLRRGKKMGFGRSVGIILIGALLGLAVGGIAENLVNVQSATGVGFASPMVIISSGVLAGLWAAVSLLE